MPCFVNESRVGPARERLFAEFPYLPGEANGSPLTRPADAAIVARARLWMLRADSALARGDLTAFGRAIEELRAVLKP